MARTTGRSGWRGPHQVLAGNDDAGRAIVGRAAHHGGQRLGHHAGSQYLLGRHHVVGLAMRRRTRGAVVPVLRRDGGEVLGRRATVVHAALRPQREVGRREDRRVDLVPAGAAATSTDHVGELVEAERHGHVGPAGADGPGGISEGHQPGGRCVLDVRDREPGQAELLHGLDAQHGGRLDVPHEGLVDVGERHVGIVQGEEAGVPRQDGAGDVLVHAETDHADAGDGDAVELESPPHAAPPVVVVPAVCAAGRKR